MYWKVLLKDGRSFLARKGFWDGVWSGWVETCYTVMDNTFGPECRGHRIWVRNSAVAGVVQLGRKQPST